MTTTLDRTPRPAVNDGRLVVEISDMKVSRNPKDVLVTYSLGSCVGVAFYDPVAFVGGLAHCMLPLASIDAKKAAARPCMFVDTGIEALLKTMFASGATRQNLVAKVAGAGSPLGKEEIFRIGQRNLTMVRKILWKNSIRIGGADVGGTAARTLSLRMHDGRTMVRIQGKGVEL